MPAHLDVIVGGGGFIIRLVYLAFFIGIPALVVWGALSMIRGSRGRDPVPSDPEQILKVRLARGEISVEEYERLRGLIRSDR